MESVFLRHRALGAASVAFLGLFLVSSGLAHAQIADRPTVAPEQLSSNKPKEPLIEFEMMTWPEVKAAMDAGKKTALIYTGGTEQRGPQNVNGGHNLMGRAVVKQIAIELGNAIALPVLPYTPNNASATLPGTIGLTPELLGMVLERITEQAIDTGFTSVILMGDHGGGQPKVYADVAKKLEEKYAPQNINVFFCDEVYANAHADFNQWLQERGNFFQLRGMQ